jgi:hypothetical protein
MTYTTERKRPIDNPSFMLKKIAKNGISNI